MALPLVQTNPGPEYYNSLADRLPVSGWDQLVTAFEAESERTVVSQLATRAELARLESEEGQRELSVDELNEKYKDIGLRFDGPQKERVAEYIAQSYRERTYLEQKIASGPQGYTSLIGRFGAGVIAHALDPVETGLTFATGGLLRLGAAAVFGRSVAPSLLGRVGVGAAEGALTQAALEPLNYSTLNKLQEDYTAAESLYNIAIGAAFGGVVEGAGYGIQKFIDRKRGVRPGAELLSHEAAIAQLLDGKKVDPSGVSADVAAELSRRIPRVSDFSGRMDYQYRPYDPLAGDGRKFYIGTMSENEALSAVERTRRGFQGFVDDAGRANADAASKYNETIGNVFEVELGDARLVDTSRLLNENEIRALNSILEGSDNKEVSKLSKQLAKGEFQTVRDLLVEAGNREILPQVADALERGLAGLGFDGYFRNMGDHNAIELFESAVRSPVKEDGRVVYRQTGVFKGDEAIVPGITTAEREAIIARRKAVETESFYNQQDMDHADAAEELGSIDEEAMDAAELQKFNEVKREIDQMDKAGLLGEDERKLIEQMDELDQKHKSMMTKFKSAIDCVWRNS